MEMELQRQTLEGCRLIYHCAPAQEETLESIVPDALPDAARIICAWGRACLLTRQAGAGSVRLAGTVQVTVLYLPEGEDIPRAMEVQLPFTCTRDCPQVQEGCLVHGEAWVVSADAQAINPRKFLIRASLSLQVRVYAREAQQVTCEVSGGEEGLEKRFVQSVHWGVAQVTEKSFAFSEVLHLPSSRPAMEEVLCCQPGLVTAQAKAIGKKLVCKGEVQLTALYRSGQSVASSQFQLPFSQICELDQPREDCPVELLVQITGVHSSLQEGELAVSLEVLLQAAVWDRQEVRLLADAYSTASPLDVERESCTLCAEAEHGQRREPVRQLCQSAIAAGQVLTCTPSVEGLDCTGAEGATRCTARLRVELLCLSEDGALYALGDTLTAQWDIPTPEGSQCQVRCEPAGEFTAVPVTGGLEVRGEVLFTWVRIQEERQPSVRAIRPGAVMADQGPRPSLTLRRVAQGESLWEVAKSCAARMDDLRAVNDLEGEGAPEGTMLLIPVQHGEE